MKFSKIGKHTIRCVISEQEIQDLGYTIEEIMSNGERTQEFMNQIFDMAEQSFETKFELGIKTVRADFMSDHTLALTFSEHPGSDEMMEHLKDIVNGLMNAIPQQKWAQINEARQTREIRIRFLFMPRLCLRILIGCSVMQKTLCQRICLRVNFINMRIAIC